MSRYSNYRDSPGYVLGKCRNRGASNLCVNVTECHSQSDNYTLARNMKQIVFGRSWPDARCLGRVATARAWRCV